jgi:hypothetical protein
MNASRLEAGIAGMVEQMFVEGASSAEIVDAVAKAEASLRSKLQRRTRGERIASDWRPSEADMGFALGRGMTRSQLDLEAEKFRNYWSAKAGAGARKVDWEATWRNWVISTMERAHGTASTGAYAGSGRAHPASRSNPTGADAVLAGMARIAHRIDQRRASGRSEDRKAPRDANVAPQLDFKRGGT